MIYDKRPWICFYEGSPPMKVAETDSWWYTMYDREGGCCLQGWPMFLLQDFMRLYEQPPPSPKSSGPADDTAQAQPAEFVRDKLRLPGNFSPSFGRFWHLTCAGSRSTDRPTRPPTMQISRDMKTCLARKDPWWPSQSSLGSSKNHAYRPESSASLFVVASAYQPWCSPSPTRLAQPLREPIIWGMTIRCTASYRVPRSLSAHSTVLVEGLCALLA